MRRRLGVYAAALLLVVSLPVGNAGQKSRSATSASSFAWVNQLVLQDVVANSYSIASASDGGAFALFWGTRPRPDTEDYVDWLTVVVRIDSRGRAVWQKAFLSNDEFDPFPKGLFPTADGGCLVQLGGPILAKLTANGSVDWHKRIWDPTGSNWMGGGESKFVRAPDGGLFGASGFGFVFRVDGSGQLVWGKRFERPANSYVSNLIVTAAGGLLLAGQPIGHGSLFLLCLDSDGVIQWQKAYRHGETVASQAVFAREEGGFLFQGSIGKRTSQVTSIFRLNAAGEFVWGRSYDAGYWSVFRKSRDGGGDTVLMGERGLIGLGADGQLVEATPLALDEPIWRASAAADGGFFLAGRPARIVKTDASGKVSGCSLVSGTASGSSPEAWFADVVSFAGSPAGVGIEDLTFTPQSLVGTWSVVCRDPNYFYLSIVSAEGGTTTPPPGVTSLERGTAVTIEAIPEAFYDFLDWIGDVPDAFRQALAFPLTMDGDKRIQPRFLKIQAPLNLTGRRLPGSLRGNAFDILTWTPHPENQSVEKYRVFSVVDGVETLLGEVPAAACRFINRKASRFGGMAYAVCAVTASGREGVRAAVEVR